MAEAKQFEDQQRPDLSGRAYGREPATSDLELVQVGPGTAGGELLRRYWQPFALAREATSEPKHIKILDECLVLFRNGDGEPGLLYPRCMHRGTDLIYGKVESNGIRCCYHGWLFAPQGQCLEIPTETNERLRTNIRQPWYPVVEKYGLLFTYMGPPEREPLFPTFSIEDQLEPGQTLQGWRSDGGPNGPHPKVSAASDYNWWQMYDNWMDPFHVCILHSTINGPQFSPNLAILPEVTFETTRDGVISIQKRRLPDGSLQQRISQVMAPNLNCTAGISDDDLGPAGVSWTVPTDDRGYMTGATFCLDSACATATAATCLTLVISPCFVKAGAPTMASRLWNGHWRIISAGKPTMWPKKVRATSACTARSTSWPATKAPPCHDAFSGSRPSAWRVAKIQWAQTRAPPTATKCWQATQSLIQIPWSALQDTRPGFERFLGIA